MTCWYFPAVLLLVVLAGLPRGSAFAQTVVPQAPESTGTPQLPLQENQPPSLQPQPVPQPPPPLPRPDELLRPSPQTPAAPQPVPGEVPTTIRVDRFEVFGSTVFTPEELAVVTAPFTNRDITFAQLLQARSAVTQLYVREGYITSGAIIPPQALEAGVVTIQVIEGSLESIDISGLTRLSPSYVRDRLELAAQTPLNVNRLLEGLQLLQLNPLIQSISADLQAGVRPGTSVLAVQVTEADSFNTTLSIDNGRSPSVGSFRRQVELTQANLLGFGDGLNVGYGNTNGSNTLNATYTLPLNPRNGTLQLAIGFSDSRVIEEPFDELEISATSHYYELTFRQPLSQTPTEEFALGLTASRQESQTELGIDDIGPFRLSPGADAAGRTRVSAVRFFQEWTQRNSQQVIAARSQFSLGLDLLDATVNNDAPDSRFLAWRGQGQWVRLLAPDALLLVRGDVQLADSALVPLEQFGLGGQQSVRGYRQDALLTDNGALLSAEVRLPILRIPEWRGLLQLSPFIDVGAAWNSGDSPAPESNALVGVGVGLLWRQGDRFSARLDWGIPLVSIDAGDSLQENGVYFSVIYSPF
ncbi:ShlB/FhaC/HecB family hemolysin secretion/activation protein [Leptolyngbya sp. ST-U4]|uniref:ShlB/FhaC/HecB family hemolysin secretion/activation protein n=2 Tax=unclassified Leptolyngbya TaxID=2650499 RepID=UPI0019C58497|nr:ShlB/FhaC/HecB family hemolysin secretion/activation protein [Cyanobacteria bacterium FACHB-502]